MSEPRVIEGGCQHSVVEVPVIVGVWNDRVRLGFGPRHLGSQALLTPDQARHVAAALLVSADLLDPVSLSDGVVFDE